MAELTFHGIRRSLMILILILLAILAVLAVINLVLFPRLRLRQIQLETSLSLSNDEILALADIKGNETYLEIDTGALKKRFELSPAIRRAYVEKKFPDTLKIVLYERIPVGIILDKANGPASCIDAEGYIYSSLSRQPYRDLPILSGAISPDGRVSESLFPLFRNLKDMQKNAPLLYGQISEIVITDKHDTFFNYTLFLNAYKLPVILATGPTKRIMEKVVLVLDTLEKDKTMENYHYVDFRTEQLVFKEKERV